MNIGGKNIINLRYADDTVLLAESSEDFKILIEETKRLSGQVGLSLNYKKTKLWWLRGIRKDQT